MKKCELLVRGGSLPLAGCHSAIGDSGTVSGGTSSDVSGGQERILANWCVTWAHRTARATLGRRSGERRSHRARQREGRAALQLRPQAPQRAPQSLYALSVRGAFSCEAAVRISLQLRKLRLCVPDCACFGGFAVEIERERVVTCTSISRSRPNPRRPLLSACIRRFSTVSLGIIRHGLCCSALGPHPRRPAQKTEIIFSVARTESVT